MHNKLQIIIDHLTNNNFQWFLDHGIEVSDKQSHWMLNYNQFGEKNEFNVLTRGLVVEKSTVKIVSFPFTRFFNLGEPHAASVDIDNSDVLEKLDGSLIGVHFSNNLPVWH